MRKGDIKGLGELAGDAAAAGGGLVQAMHEGIAGRPFGILGDAAAPVRVVHDGIASAVYAGVRGGLRALAHVGTAAVAVGGDDSAPALTDRPAGAMALGAVNGLYGDHLSARRRRLALGMEIRCDGQPVPLDRDGIAAAYPGATSRIAVFVHGLFGDEDSWRLFPLRGRHPGRRTYAARLRDDLGLTPVLLRYNTGLHVSHNGRELAGQLEQLVAGWPVAVEEIVFVGHSMGGLVARSACHYGEQDRHRWVDAVRHVVSLGSPHLGADLEKGLNVASWAFGRVPETRALAVLLNARSAGIKDLRFGACVDGDWDGCEDPDEFLRDRCTEVPFLPGAHYWFVGATLLPGPAGMALGDLLVRVPSASGRGDGKGRRIPFGPGNGHELSGLTHLDLLNHDEVYAQLRRWLTAGAPGAAASAS